jgi:ABC-type transport system involved in multi-copper enzyme maturation permease subunit
MRKMGMIDQIAKKEIHHNLYSIRFPALLVISAILFILNGVLAVTEPIQEIRKPNPSTTWITVSRQNDKLQFCARGASADRIQNVNVRIGGSIAPWATDNPSQLPTGDRLGRFALPHADRIDWMFIIKMLFSLFAIILSFDAISWEREQSTLTLMCSNSVSRSSVLLGKYLGACGTLMIPLVTGIVLNMLIILVVGGIAGTVPLQIEHWLRIGMLTLASILYISLFVLLGLLVSSLVQRSSSSLLILLSVWVALVVVLPNLAGILAEQTSKVESEYQLSRRQRQIWKLGGIEALNKQIDSGKVKTQEELDRAAEGIFTRMMGIINDTESEHRDALVAKRRSARRIAMASPAAIYQYISEAIADSGFERQQRFLRSIGGYYPIYENYVRGKVKKIIPSCRWSFSMSRSIDGKQVHARSPRPEDYKGDMSDFPYFAEPRWSIMDSLRVTLTDMAVLFLWNILFFVAAHYVFVKRSLR